MRKINIIWSLLLLSLCGCSDNNIDVQKDDEVVISGGRHGSTQLSIPVSNLHGDNSTRAIYDFFSDNLTYLRLYEVGDKYFVANQHFAPESYCGPGDPGLDWDVAFGNDLNLFSYRPVENDFWCTNLGHNFFYKSYNIWDSPKYPTGYINDDDTLMTVIMDKKCRDLIYQPHKWAYTSNSHTSYNPSLPPDDTCFVLGLSDQDGTKEDCFSRQLPWVRYPVYLTKGTHVWKYLTSYYWLILLFDSTEVASIDTVRIHAEEPMYDHVYWKYNATVSYLAKDWGMVDGGPFALGCDTIYPIEKGWKHADIFISFFPGEGGEGRYHNFGFEVGWTDKFGVHHDSKDPKNQDNVRPQVKIANAGNVYKDAMTLTLEHGLQNMYEDEVVEIDNWNTKVDSTVIIKKD